MSNPANACRFAGFSLLLSLSMPSTLSAQDLTGQCLTLPGSAADCSVAIHTAESDAGWSYGIWGASNRYKASFHGAATFVPYLGDGYPHNQPWSWSTVSACVGELQLATKEPQVAYRGMHAEYDLGAIVEAYDLRADGLEQTFVIANRPAQNGDLVIRGAVQSALSAKQVVPAHQALTFFDAAGRAILDYGAATAVDASGRRLAMTTGYRDGEITLRVPAAWLAEASFPVVVDPLVTTAATLPGDLLTNSDVLRDSESPINGTWSAIVRAVSATDHDLWMHRWLDDGTVQGTAFADVTASWDTQGGSVAYNAASNYAVCVFDRTFVAGSRALRFHRHHRNDATQNATYASIAAGNNAWRADVGGTDFGFSGSNVLVVWQQEPNSGGFATSNSSDIYACAVNLLTNSAASPFLVAGGTFSDMERPSINQVSAGSINNSWLVAYQTISTLLGADDWDVAVKEVDESGTVSSPKYVDNTSSDHKMAPRIAGANGRYLVAFVSSTLALQPGNYGGDDGYEVRSVRVDWPTGTGNGTEPWGTTVVLPDVGDTYRLGSLSFDRNDRSHWVFVSQQSVGAVVHLDLHLLGYRGEQVRTESVNSLIAAINAPLLYHTSFDEFADEFITLRPINTPFNHSVSGARFQYPTITLANSTGTSCSSAAIAWQGSQQIGSEFGSVEVTGTAVDSLHVVALSLAISSTSIGGIGPFQPGCRLNVSSLAPQFVGLFPLQIGADPTFQLPLPEFLGSNTYYFQDFHTLGNGNLNMVSTARLRVPVVK